MVEAPPNSGRGEVSHFGKESFSLSPVTSSPFSFCSFFEVIKPFLGKLVTVEIEGYAITGRLIRFCHSNKNGHSPNILILKNGKTLTLIRGSWTAIKSLELKK